MLGGAVTSLLGWAATWFVMLTRHLRSVPGALVDLTPTVPLLLPAALMVGGVVWSLMSF